MGKIMMDKVDKNVLLEMVLGEDIEVVIPDVVKVTDIQTGSFDRGEQGLMHWANLSVVSLEELELLSQVGLERNASELKIKLANYQNESLKQLIDKELKTDDFDVVFLDKRTNRGTEIVGVCFRTDYATLRKGAFKDD